MKKLVLETTAPFQGLPELVAYDEGLFEKEGLIVEWADREKDVRQEDRDQRDQSEGARPVCQPRQAARAGPGRHVQRLRMGQLLPRPGHRVGSRQVGRRGIVTYAALAVRPDSPVYTAAAAGRPHRRRAVLFRHPLSRAPHAGRVPAARPDQGLPRAQRLALPLRRDDEGRDRGHHADRALCHARREEGLPR